jgi:hypothetical protein
MEVWQLVFKQSKNSPKEEIFIACINITWVLNFFKYNVIGIGLTGEK